jgi:predicted transposase/invertase (TIGR01784 family)
MRAILPAKYDEVFKMLFGSERNKAILVDFLKAVLPLPADDYGEVALTNPFLMSELLHDKTGILDVSARTKSGRQINIEIQVASHAAFKERILHYLTRRFSSQIHAGESYTELKQTIGIVITDFELTKSEDYYGAYNFCDVVSGLVFSEVLMLYVLELPKLMRVGEKGRCPGAYPWLRLVVSTSEEELEMLVKDYPEVRAGVEALCRLSEDERAWQIHEARERGRRDIAARIEDAEKKGRKEGREEERLLLACKMLRRGRPMEEVMEDTGLSREEIQRLWSEGRILH